MPEHEEEDILDLTEDMPEEEHEQEEPEADEDAEEAESEGEDGFSIELEGEQEEDQPTLIKTLREELRATKRELHNHRRAQAEPAKIEVGPEPKLEDFDYEQDKWREAWDQWTERRHQSQNQERERNEQERVRNEEFERNVAKYRAKAAALPVRDFQDAEATVRDALPEMLQSAIITYTDDPAKLIYALYKHPTQLAALAKEPDPVKAILAMSKMEGKLKVTTRKAPPAPMSGNVQRGSAPVAAGDYEKNLEKLEKEAARTGNRTKVIEYKRAHKGGK